MAGPLYLGSPGNSTPNNGKGRLKKEGFLGHAAGLAFVGFDTISRVKEGDSVPGALAKAALTNAAWNLVPGGLGAMLGITALQMAPEVTRALDMAKSNLGSRSVAFGGGFTQNEGQEYMKQTGLQNAMGARQQASAIMSRHARGAAKSY